MSKVIMIPEVRHGIRVDSTIVGEAIGVEFDERTNAIFLQQDTDCIRVHPDQLLRLFYLIGQAIYANEKSQIYTCKGKGGRYMLFGDLIDAGTSRSEQKDVVYRDIDSGQWFRRTVEDFNERMEKIDG